MAVKRRGISRRPLGWLGITWDTGQAGGGKMKLGRREGRVGRASLRAARDSLGFPAAGRHWRRNIGKR